MQPFVKREWPIVQPPRTAIILVLAKKDAIRYADIYLIMRRAATAILLTVLLGASAPLASAAPPYVGEKPSSIAFGLGELIDLKDGRRAYVENKFFFLVVGGHKKIPPAGVYIATDGRTFVVDGHAHIVNTGVRGPKSAPRTPIDATDNVRENPSGMAYALGEQIELKNGHRGYVEKNIFYFIDGGQKTVAPAGVYIAKDGRTFVVGAGGHVTNTGVRGPKH